jgi:hypothetical protein
MAKNSPQGDGKAATSSPQEAVKAATGGEFSSLMDNDAGFAGLSVSFRESIGGRQRDKSRQGGTKWDSQGYVLAGRDHYASSQNSRSQAAKMRFFGWNDLTPSQSLSCRSCYSEQLGEPETPF